MQNTVSNYNIPNTPLTNPREQEPNSGQDRQDAESYIREEERQTEQARRDEAAHRLEHARRDEQTRLDEQSRQDEQTRAEQISLEAKEAQLHENIRREQEDREFAERERDELERQERFNEIEAEKKLADERRIEIDTRDEDERAYKAAEEKFKELEELQRQRQEEGRLGTNSADSLLSRFFDLIEKVKQEHGFDNRDHKPELTSLYNSGSPADFHRQAIDELLNSFDKNLDVEKDIDLSVNGPMLIDELDHYFDLDRDIEENWNIDRWAEREFSLDDATFDATRDATSSPFASADNINSLLFEDEHLPYDIEWNRTASDLQIDSWERNAYNPELLREQNELAQLSVREGGNAEVDHSNYSQYEYSNNSLLSNEHNSIDQIMQQQMQQIMQTQIQQTFSTGSERTPFEQSISEPDKEQLQQQEQNRDEDSYQHTR